jgi:hypothetical protein
MARKWFFIETSIGVNADDISILNRAARHLVDSHNLSPTVRWLSAIRDAYKPGMSAADVIAAVNDLRAETRAAAPVINLDLKRVERQNAEDAQHFRDIIKLAKSFT